MWYVLDAQTREVIKTSEQYFSINLDADPGPDVIWLERVIDETQPAYDPATQKLNRTSVDDDVARTRTFFYEVVALTQEEIDAEAQRQADAAELLQLKAIYQDLKNGVGTATERMQRVERCVAWLLKDYARDNLV